MIKSTSITLGGHFEEIVNESIESGRHTSVSEVIHAGLMLLEKEETEFKNLQKAIEKSGVKDDFDPEKHLVALNNRYGS